MTRSRVVLAGAIVGVVALMFLVAILTASEQGAGEDSAEIFGDPAVAGEPLPATVAGQDPGAGLPAPEVEGANFAGEPVAIEADGRAKMLVFLAHWCEFCQQEVPEVQQWIEAGRLPDAVDLIGVATGIDPQRPNFPPSEWFEREGWSSPVLVDDADNTVGDAFGVNAYPAWAFLDDQHQVVSRASGNLTVEQLDAIAEGLAAGVTADGAVDGGATSDADNGSGE